VTNRAVTPGASLAWCEIDLNAVRENYRTIRDIAGSQITLFAVVKADAYGHGAVEVSRVLQNEGVTMLCVARVEEAVELREAGITTPLLVLAPPFAPQAEAGLNADCSFVVCSKSHLDALTSAATQKGTQARVHLKIDTGMGRLGIPPSSGIEFMRGIQENPSLLLEGVMAHLPFSDAVLDSEMQTSLGSIQFRETERQIKTLADLRSQAEASALTPRYWHTSNTAAILQHPSNAFNAARTGIALYGQYPSYEMRRDLPLRAAMTFKTTISFLKDVPSGVGLSYGHVYQTSRKSRIATVALGYADGYPRHATNLTQMLVREQRVPVVGRVCMDHILLDVTDVPETTEGDIAIAFGTDRDTLLSAEEMASRFGSLGYELTTRIGKRVPKVFIGA
jgi:alanine racemase